jgi:carboxylesterase type B
MQASTSAAVLLRHDVLGTTFAGVEHALSTPAAPVAQFRGVRYATIPARFRAAQLLTEYPDSVDASCYG